MTSMLQSEKLRYSRTTSLEQLIIEYIINLVCLVITGNRELRRKKLCSSHINALCLSLLYTLVCYTMFFIFCLFLLCICNLRGVSCLVCLFVFSPLIEGYQGNQNLDSKSCGTSEMLPVCTQLNRLTKQYKWELLFSKCLKRLQHRHNGWVQFNIWK